jgi:hypothetical protein
MNAGSRRGAIKGGRLGLLAGLCLAGIYLALGWRGNELTQLLAYSCVIIGFPVVLAISYAAQLVGLGGLTEYAALVLLTLPLNFMLWGGLVGAVLLRSDASVEYQGRGHKRGAA